MAIDPEFKKEWIAALRSEDYAQTTFELMNDGTKTYCCLGVATDLLVKKGITSWEVHYIDEIGTDGEPALLCKMAYIPEDLAEYVGITIEQQKLLSTLNDKHSLSFTKIADYIENMLGDTDD